MRCINLDSFIVYIKEEDIYVKIAKDVETRFDIQNYELDRELATEKNWKSYWINERWIRYENNKIIWDQKKYLKYRYLADRKNENKI